MNNAKLLQAVKDYAENNSMVYISVEEYNELQTDQRFLRALLSAGVDNWDGFDHAMDMMVGPELI